MYYLLCNMVDSSDYYVCIDFIKEWWPKIVSWELAPAKNDFHSRQKTPPVKNARLASTASPLFSLENLKRSPIFLLEVCVRKVQTRPMNASKTCQF